MDKFKRFLINTSIGASAVRNQGKGVIHPIRDTLYDIFEFDEFYNALFSARERTFAEYLDWLTNSLKGLKGYDKDGKPTGAIVSWGIARKCINLVLRSCIYNGHIWQSFGISRQSFSVFGPLQRLEIPLDSYSVDGIKKKCDFLNLEYDNALFTGFRIRKLIAKDSETFQQLLHSISLVYGICRIDWDVLFWRAEDDE